MEGGLGWFGREAMSDDERRHALAHELGIPFVELSRDDISVEALVLIPEPIAREHNLLGYRVGEGALEIALLNMEELEQLNFLRSQYRLLPRLTTRDSLNRGLVRYQQHLREHYGKTLEQGDSPQLLDALLRHALHSRASDIHLQTESKGILVRYRINGMLKNSMMLAPSSGGNILAKLRTLAKTPAGTLPREGAFKVDLGSGEDLLVRVSSVPTIGGEKLVLHLSRESVRKGFTLEGLGLHGEALEAVHKMLLKRRGLITVSGSGKTTLMYTLLDLLNTPEHSLATVEDRVGYVLPRVAQTELSTSGLSPAAALRAALKADADIVMIDTLRDRESATIAQAAAARGILVIAAVDDAELLPEPGLSITSALIRKIAGKQFPNTHKLTRAQADQLEQVADFASVLSTLKEEGRVEKDLQWKDVQFYKPVGSTEHPDGYHGLLGAQQVSFEGKPVGLNLVEDALFKAAQGQTTLEEVQNLATF